MSLSKEIDYFSPMTSDDCRNDELGTDTCNTMTVLHGYLLTPYVHIASGRSRLPSFRTIFITVADDRLSLTCRLTFATLFRTSGLLGRRVTVLVGCIVLLFRAILELVLILVLLLSRVLCVF